MKSTIGHPVGAYIVVASGTESFRADACGIVILELSALPPPLLCLRDLIEGSRWYAVWWLRGKDG